MPPNRIDYPPNGVSSSPEKWSLRRKSSPLIISSIIHSNPLSTSNIIHSWQGSFQSMMYSVQSISLCRMCRPPVSPSNLVLLAWVGLQALVLVGWFQQLDLWKNIQWNCNFIGRESQFMDNQII